MTRMGIRELRDNLPAVIRRVRAGEGIEVTDHGHPVARLVPINVRSQYEQLVAEGRIIPPRDRPAGRPPGAGQARHADGLTDPGRDARG
jgi:prevent-host-death family protein